MSNDQVILRAIKQSAENAALFAYKSYIKGAATKTVDAFQRSMWRDVRDLYNGKIDEYIFLDSMTALIANQLGKAWRHGALEVDVTPDEFTAEDNEHLQIIIDNEYEFLPRLTQDIIDARRTGIDVRTFERRIDLWVNRYTEVVNEAHVWFAKRQKYEWTLGNNENHCHTGDAPGKVGCADLAGIVAYGYEWEEAKIMPQNPGSGESPLACGGWACHCTLAPTNKRHTTHALDKLLQMRLEAAGL